MKSLHLALDDAIEDPLLGYYRHALLPHVQRHCRPPTGTRDAHTAWPKRPVHLGRCAAQQLAEHVLRHLRVSRDVEAQPLENLASGFLRRCGPRASAQRPEQRAQVRIGREEPLRRERGVDPFSGHQQCAPDQPKQHLRARDRGYLAHAGTIAAAERSDGQWRSRADGVSVQKR
jgi:hypothetical protein